MRGCGALCLEHQGRLLVDPDRHRPRQPTFFHRSTPLCCLIVIDIVENQRWIRDIELLTRLRWGDGQNGDVPVDDPFGIVPLRNPAPLLSIAGHKISDLAKGKQIAP